MLLKPLGHLSLNVRINLAETIDSRTLHGYLAVDDGFDAGLIEDGSCVAVFQTGAKCVRSGLWVPESGIGNIR